MLPRPLPVDQAAPGFGETEKSYAVHLALWAKVNWRLIVVYTVASGVFLYGLFNWLVPVQWHESPFFSLFS